MNLTLFDLMMLFGAMEFLVILALALFAAWLWRVICLRTAELTSAREARDAAEQRVRIYELQYLECE